MYLRVILVVFLAFILADSFAQSRKRKKKAEKEAVAAQKPNSLNPYSSNSKKEYAPRVSHKSSRGPTYNLQEEYYERMAEVAKKRKKIERLMEKPQYSNPLYFGHKRPPKKRKPSKMKFCKECGIRH
jgi:hypothetical protein